MCGVVEVSLSSWERGGGAGGGVAGRAAAVAARQGRVRLRRLHPAAGPRRRRRLLPPGFQDVSLISFSFNLHRLLYLLAMSLRFHHFTIFPFLTSKFELSLKLAMADID